MASLSLNNPAPNGPGDPAPWTRADKDAVGTARSASSQVWFTIADGLITEVYYPDVDTPQVRDLQLIITDGSTFFHDARKDFTHQCEWIDPKAQAFRVTNTAIGQPYSVVQEIITEPQSSCLLVKTTLVGQQSFLDRLRVYVLLAPHMAGYGAGNDAYVASTASGAQLVASRGNFWLALGADCGFGMTSCGFVGQNDGWTDIVANRRLPVWNYDSAIGGYVALTAEIQRAGQNRFVMALAFCTDEATPITKSMPNAALVAVAEALAYPFDDSTAPYAHLQAFIKGWYEAVPSPFVPKPGTTGDGDRLFNLSRNVLLSHEDKTAGGALVASLSIPWGELAYDLDCGYHMVWPRDMCQSATALLAAGEVDVPLRGLMFLATSQSADGSFHQKFFIDGQPWPGDSMQLDEFSAPIILAYHLNQAGVLKQFDPKRMVLAAAGALIKDGPMTQQERWEENEGYSPSTLASNIAGLVCAAELAKNQWADPTTAQFLLDYADFLESNLEKWCVTTQGDLLPGTPRHYIRLLPTHVKDLPKDFSLSQDPNTAWIRIGNPDRWFPAKHIVDGGFLELVRYGIRDPHDPAILDTLKVIDTVLKAPLPGGPGYHRYNNDGYGQGDAGQAWFSGALFGVGRPWPLLSGERAHYEVAAGNDAKPYVRYLEAFAGSRGLVPEQLWDLPNLVNPPFVTGGPTGSAMPLAWGHAEYIKLVRSVSDGKVFDRLDVVAGRYLVPHPASPLEIWNLDRQPQTMQAGQRLRIPLGGNFRLRWSVDHWTTFTDTASMATAVGIYYVDVPTVPGQVGTQIQFTIYWFDSQTWIGINYGIMLTP